MHVVGLYTHFLRFSIAKTVWCHLFALAQYWTGCEQLFHMTMVFDVNRNFGMVRGVEEMGWGVLFWGGGCFSEISEKTGESMPGHGSPIQKWNVC